jgi:hypothetical protein
MALKHPQPAGNFGKAVWRWWAKGKILANTVKMTRGIFRSE